MAYNAGKAWTKGLLSFKMMFPAENLIRIFKGKYPKLHLAGSGYEGKSICDVGCGDGRNFVLFRQLGARLHGVELTPEIVARVRSNLKPYGISPAMKVGGNGNIPFPDASMDYVVSWNSCYYMGQSRDFGAHVREFARVVKPGGALVLSIPKKTSFIFKDSKRLKGGFRLITEDPYGIRVGEVLRCFSGEAEIREAFSPYFRDFAFASVHDDCFGYDYHWHLVVCRRKGRPRRAGRKP